jgi:lactate racemase
VGETYRAVIPYESMDPLTIGASDDETKKYRDQLELEIPTRNLLAAIYPDEPAHVPDATEAARRALESPQSGPRFSELLAGKSSIAVIIDNQFRPTPSSKLLPPVLDAIEAAGITDARVVCANGKVFPMSDSDIEQKVGRANLDRMERLGIPFFQNDPRNGENYTFVGVSSRGTPVWLHKEVAKSEVKITIGQAQSNHWGAGGGGKLILPGVVSDETIESNHCAFVPSPQTHYGALAGPMRSDIDEVATMCGLDCTMNVLLDTHGRVLDAIFGRHPEAHRAAIEKFNSIYAYENPVEQQGQADIAICGVFAPTDHLFFHTGWGCMSADFVLKDGGSLIYCSPSPGVSTALGDFPGLALMDLMKPYMPPSRDNYEQVLRDIHSRTIQMWAGCIWVPIYEVMTRKHLTMVTLQENLEMAADIGIEATTSLDEAFAAAMERHGPDAKVIVLPFARYQLPRNAIRMHASDAIPRGAVPA